VSNHYAKNDVRGAGDKVTFAIKLTVVAGLPCALGLIVLAEPVTRLLYGGLSQQEILLAADMVRIAGGSILFLSLVQTSTAVLQAGGRLYAPVVFLFVATIVKTVLSIVLLQNQTIGIFGAPVSSVICYFVACLLDLLYIVRIQKINLPLGEVMTKPLACGLVMTVFLLATRNIVFALLPNWLGVFVLVGFGVVVYAVMMPVVGLFDRDEASKVPVVGKIVAKLWREKQR